MKPVSGTKIFEGELATFWFEENGILCAIGKIAPRTLEKQKENYRFIKEISGNKKICLLSDNSSSSTYDRETREYMAIELPNVFKAMAVISNSALGRFTVNLFLALKRQPVPIKLFRTETEAIEWLKNYL